MMILNLGILTLAPLTVCVVTFPLSIHPLFYWKLIKGCVKIVKRCWKFIRMRVLVCWKYYDPDVRVEDRG